MFLYSGGHDFQSMLLWRGGGGRRCYKPFGLHISFANLSFVLILLYVVCTPSKDPIDISTQLDLVLFEDV